MIQIVIPGEMRGKGRPRFARRDPYVQAFTDARTANMETWVKACAVTAYRGAPIEGPVSLRVDIGIGVPKSWAAKRRAGALAGAAHPTGRPDLDNCGKLVSDALNGILWRDDSQVVELVMTKRYVEAPQTILTVRRLP